MKQIVPDKRIRYLVSTHFHFDHLSGVRPFIAEGATLISTEDAKHVIESKIVVAKHLRRPDSLSTHPRAAVVETVAVKRVFDDGAHRVEIYDIGPNPHARQMLIAYLPKQKLLLEADMFDLSVPEGSLGVSGADTRALLNKIDELKLDVEHIIPVHGRPGTIEELRRTVSRPLPFVKVNGLNRY